MNNFEVINQRGSFDEPDKNDGETDAYNFDEKYSLPNAFKSLGNKLQSVYGPTSVFDTTSVSKLENSRELREMEEIIQLRKEKKNY